MSRGTHLVETEWLAEHLHDPGVRVLECTVYDPSLPMERG